MFICSLLQLWTKKPLNVIMHFNFDYNYEKTKHYSIHYEYLCNALFIWTLSKQLLDFYFNLSQQK